MAENQDSHPIRLAPQGATVEERLHWYEHHLALLWDQVWWLSLTPEARANWEAQGFAAPISQFYGRSEPFPWENR
jgi:hypothetical protein